ncbi:MAG: tetraacyldisaccharide 4'-kinase [Rhodoferax sp.]|nr:tetraacyldisaccharide 4'-kinase [Rhodoferax sp.]
MSAQPPGGQNLGLEQKIKRAWTGRGLLACTLWPIAQMYGALVALRRILYRTGIYSVLQVPVRVIVVGNLVAGGAGKTPTTIALAQHLTARQFKVGLVSRGFGRQGKDCREVFASASPEEVGDEPLLVHRVTGLPVFVAPSRHAAAMALLAEYPETEIILCDDGLQHLQLFRDLEVCVFDERGIGNGWLLPAGPLREPWPRRACARSGQHDSSLLVLHTSGQASLPGFRATRTLADYALRSDGSRVPLDQLAQSHALPCIALAGIARPHAFFAMLRARGIPLTDTVALPDHYDFHSYSRPTDGRYQLICTEKDAAKLWAKDPSALAVPLIQTAEPAFWAALDAHVDAWQETTPDAKLSSPHGHPTT